MGRHGRRHNGVIRSVVGNEYNWGMSIITDALIHKRSRPRDPILLVEWRSPFFNQESL